MALEILTTFALAKNLGASGFGVYSFAFAVTRIVALPAQAGLPTLAVREVAKYEVREEYSLLRGFISWSRLAVLAFSLLLISIGAAVVYTHPISAIPSQLLILSLILVPLVALGNLRGGVLRGLHRVLLGQLPENVIRPAIFVLLIFSWPLFAWDLDASSAMGLHIIAAAASFAWGAWMQRRTVPREVWRSSKRFEKDAWWRALLPLSIFGGMQILNAQLSVLVLGLYRSTEDVGVFRVASQIGLLAGFAQIVVNMAVAPSVARIFAAGNSAQLGRLMRNSANAVFIATLALVLGISILGRPLLGIAFGAAFVVGYMPMLVMAAGQLAAAWVGIAMISLNMTGNERLLTKSIGVATLVNVLGHLLLVPEFGLMGAALSTAATTLLGGLLAGHYAKKALGVNPCVALV